MLVSTYTREGGMNIKQSNIRMNKVDRRLQILESAMEVFVDKGYNGATTQEIARAANISEVTLFRYFSSKKEIFQEGVEPILMDTLKQSIIASKDLKSKEKLKYILTERIKLISSNHKVIRLILMESQINPELVDLDIIEKISMLLRNSIKDMELEVNNEEFSFRILMGSILSFLYLPEIEDNNIELYVDSILNYMVK